MNNIGEVNICQNKKKVPPKKPPRLTIRGKTGINPKPEKEKRNLKEDVGPDLKDKNVILNKENLPHPKATEITGNNRDYEEIHFIIDGKKPVDLDIAVIEEQVSTEKEHIYESISDHKPTRSTSSQTEDFSIQFEDSHFSRAEDLKVFKETSSQTEDTPDILGLKRTKKRNSEDRTMAALGKPKECRLSSASSTSTQESRDSVDSGHFSAEIRNPKQSPTSPEPSDDNDMRYLWQPEGLSQEEVKSFMDSLPSHKVPSTVTPEGMTYFNTQLVYQNPEQDMDPSLCKSLTTKDQSLALKNVWVECVKSRRTGCIQLAESSKNACKSCGKLFDEKEVIVSAEDGFRHPSCFSCTVCHELLVKLTYYFDGSDRLFCARHYAELFKPRCFGCDELVISGKIIRAMDHAWHADHFCCSNCGKKIGENKYTIEQEKPICMSCHTAHVADKCEGCGKKIVIGQKKMSYGEKHWHDECFICEKCQDTLTLGSFSITDEKVICIKCYQQKKTKLCYKCGDAIKPGSRLIEYNGQNYHSACFSCEFCCQRINSTVIEHKKSFYCPECYHRLFSEKCVQCGLPVTGNGVTYNDEVWHSSCFDCFFCHEPISSQKFLVRFGNRYCNGCYEKMFAKECHSCCELIKDTAYLTTNDMFWHNDCFRCADCQKDLKTVGFHMTGEKIYCSECPGNVY